MNLTWKPMKFATGETTMVNDTKLGIIRHKNNVWSAYAGNKKLLDSKSKKEALRRVLDEINTQGRLF